MASFSMGEIERVLSDIQIGTHNHESGDVEHHEATIVYEFTFAHDFVRSQEGRVAFMAELVQMAEWVRPHFENHPCKHCVIIHDDPPAMRGTLEYRLKYLDE